MPQGDFCSAFCLLLQLLVCTCVDDLSLLGGKGVLSSYRDKVTAYTLHAPCFLDRAVFLKMHNHAHNNSNLWLWGKVIHVASPLTFSHFLAEWVWKCMIRFNQIWKESLYMELTVMWCSLVFAFLFILLCCRLYVQTRVKQKSKWHVICLSYKEW